VVSSEALTAPEDATDSSDALAMPCGAAGATCGVGCAALPATGPAVPVIRAPVPPVIWPTVRTAVPSGCRWASQRAKASRVAACTARPPQRLPPHTWWKTSGSQPP
jgi:hypothetical protein